MIEGIIDTHTQLYFRDFDADRAEVCARAREAGVSAWIEVGNDWATSQAAIAAAAADARVFAMAGVHPHYAAEAPDAQLEGFARLYSAPKVVAVGEVGLDFFRNLSPREEQERVLRRFLRYASETGKPLVLHCRDAFPELLGILRGFGAAPYRGVMHCFTGNAAEMGEFLDLGLHISFAGPLTYKRNAALREACAACPPERLLIETDAPYLPPQSKRGGRNEPAFIIETAEAAAALQGMPLEAFIARTAANAVELFGLDL